MAANRSARALPGVPWTLHPAPSDFDSISILRFDRLATVLIGKKIGRWVGRNQQRRRMVMDRTPLLASSRKSMGSPSTRQPVQLAGEERCLPPADDSAAPRIPRSLNTTYDLLGRPNHRFTLALSVNSPTGSKPCYLKEKRKNLVLPRFNATTRSSGSIDATASPCLTDLAIAASQEVGQSLALPCETAGEKKVAATDRARPQEIVVHQRWHGISPITPILGFALRRNGRHIITTAIEHGSRPQSMPPGHRKRRLSVTYYRTDHEGQRSEECAARSGQDTILITVRMQHELGHYPAREEIGRLAAEAMSTYHTEQCNRGGHIHELMSTRWGVDALFLGATIVRAKGIGAVCPRRHRLPAVYGGNPPRGFLRAQPPSRASWASV